MNETSTSKAKVYVPAESAWGFFLENKDRLSKEMVLIAENGDCSIYMTASVGRPMFCAYYGEIMEYREETINEYDCARTAEEFYATYLFDDEDPEEPEEMSEQEKMDIAYEREDELVFAMCDFLEKVFDVDGKEIDVLQDIGRPAVEDILDATLAYISDTYGLEIYYPQFVVDGKTGEETYTEYPYS